LINIFLWSARSSCSLSVQSPEVAVTSIGQHYLKVNLWEHSKGTSYMLLNVHSSSAVRVARSVSRNVTTNRSRLAKTLVGTNQINSPASSGFTEQHASVKSKHTLSSLQAATLSADFNYKSPGHRNQPPTSNVKELRLKLCITQVVYLQSVSIKVHTIRNRALIVGLQQVTLCVTLPYSISNFILLFPVWKLWALETLTII
jgi:hypothetical protein